MSDEMHSGSAYIVMRVSPLAYLSIKFVCLLAYRHVTCDLGHAMPSERTTLYAFIDLEKK